MPGPQGIPPSTDDRPQPATGGVSDAERRGPTWRSVQSGERWQNGKSDGYWKTTERQGTTVPQGESLTTDTITGEAESWRSNRLRH